MNIKKWRRLTKLNPMENEDTGVSFIQIMSLSMMGVLIAMDKPKFFLFLCVIFVLFLGFYLWMSDIQKKYVINVLKAKKTEEAYSSYVYLKYSVHEKGFLSSFFSFFQMCFIAGLNVKSDNNILKISDYQSLKIALFSWSESSYMLFLNWGVLLVFAASFYLLWRSVKPHLYYNKSEKIVKNDAILLSKYNNLFVEEDICFEKFRNIAREQMASEERALLSDSTKGSFEKSKRVKRL